MTSHEKHCPKCDQRLPIESFYRDRSRKDGRAALCKSCHRAILKIYQESPRGREMKRLWRKTPKGRAEMRRHNQRPSTKEWKRRDWDKHGLEIQRRYNKTEKSRERVRKYQRSPKGRATVTRLAAIRRASRTIEASLTADQWQTILKQFENRCAYCGRDNLLLERDHVIPVTKGGSHTTDNVVPACRSCNARKGNRLLSRS